MALALTSDQKEAIWFVMRRNFGPDVKIWVFGSRARGEDTGDIDLYAEVADGAGDMLIHKLKAKAQIEVLVEEAVDLIVRRMSDRKTAFDEAAKTSGVPLLQ